MLTGGFREPPIDHQRFAVFADDDIPRLDVPVQDAAAVCVVDRIADVREPPQELHHLQRPHARAVFERLVGMEVFDGILEAVALDKAHRVIRTSAGVGAEAVDWHDTGVLKSAGDLGLDQKALAAAGVIGVAIEDLFERHLTVQLAVEGHEDGTESALRVWSKDAEPLPVARGRADGIGAGAVQVGPVVRAGAQE